MRCAVAIRSPWVLALLLVSATVAAPIFAAESPALRDIKDRTAIEKLMWNYARALDTGNADAYAAVYTADGAFGDTKGCDALKKMINDLNKSREERKAKGEVVVGTLHMTADHDIEFTDADHATVRYYWLTAFVPPPAAPGAARPEQRVPFTGHGEDHLIRVNGKWLIQTRNVTAKD